MVCQVCSRAATSRLAAPSGLVVWGGWLAHHGLALLVWVGRVLARRRRLPGPRSGDARLSARRRATSPGGVTLGLLALVVGVGVGVVGVGQVGGLD
jgi:hypothetical protein